MSEHLTARFGGFTPFIGMSDREEGRAGGLQVGFTTYDTEEATGRETYQTSYLEWGGRSDHLKSAIDSMRGIDTDPQYVDDCGGDSAYVRAADTQKVAPTNTSEASA